MKPAVFIACLACKITHALLRLLKRGGTALPGKIALKICPDVLSVLSKNFKIVSVTGTNGKTTTCRIIEAGFRKAGFKVFANKSGANLINGITAGFIMNSTLSGKPKCEWAVIECDEASSVQVFSKIRPRVVLVTNLFRDQLDRYGEISHTRDFIIAGIKGTPDACLCLNADCPITSSIACGANNRIRFFGVNKSAFTINAQSPVLSDAPYCYRCGTKYDYDYVAFAHLGGYKCSGCGYERRHPDVAVTNILNCDEKGSTVELNVDGKKYSAEVKLPALYNVYNAAGAISAMTAAGLDAETAISAVSEFRSAFGRMEELQLDNAACKMILVKNPTAMNQALEYFCKYAGKAVLMLGLNDRLADGKDISWIWDVNMEMLSDKAEHIARIVVFGDRSADMMLRLKYADVDRVEIIKGCRCKKVVKQIKASQYPVYILLTYTAMLKLRREIAGGAGQKFMD